jgi:hypothetical protein
MIGVLAYQPWELRVAMAGYLVDSQGGFSSPYRVTLPPSAKGVHLLEAYILISGTNDSASFRCDVLRQSLTNDVYGAAESLTGGTGFTLPVGSDHKKVTPSPWTIPKLVDGDALTFQIISVSSLGISGAELVITGQVL